MASSQVCTYMNYMKPYKIEPLKRNEYLSEFNFTHNENGAGDSRKYLNSVT